MKSEIVDFGTGWYGLKIRLNEPEIDKLIDFLGMLKADEGYHFHLFSTVFDTVKGGVADIEFSRKTHFDFSDLEIGA